MFLVDWFFDVLAPVIVDWFFGVLAWFGFKKANIKKANIVFIGLDSSGRTTLFHMLKYKRFVQHPRREFPRTEDLNIGNIKYKVSVLNHQMVPFYHLKVDAVVYLVDATDQERFDESKKVLHGLLSDYMLANVPFLILGNKADILYASREEDLQFFLDLGCFNYPPTGKGKVSLAGSNRRPLEIFMCSLVHKTGYNDGFEWLSQYIY